MNLQITSFQTHVVVLTFKLYILLYVCSSIIAEFTNIQNRALQPPEDSEELMSMVQFVEQARSAGMVKLNERIKNAMERLQYLMDTYLFEQGK